MARFLWRLVMPEPSFYFTIWYLYDCYWCLAGFLAGVTRRVSLVKQKLLTFLEHPILLPVFSGVRVFSVVFLYYGLYLFLMTIVLSFSRITTSDSFGIFNLFVSLLFTITYRIYLLNLSTLYVHLTASAIINFCPIPFATFMQIKYV